MNKQLWIAPKAVKDLNEWKKDAASGNYRAFVTVRKVNKMGRRHLIMCPYQKRLVHLLSDGELRTYYCSLLHKGMNEVLEQFALDIDETMAIARQMKVIHPRDHKTNEAKVMSTDFVVTYKHANLGRTIAYTFKYWDQIYCYDESGRVKKKNTRTWQKFEIEQRYWAARNIDYRVVTEKDSTKELAWNLQYCQDSLNLIVEPVLLSKFVATFKKSWCADCSLTLEHLCELSARALNIAPQNALDIFKYCVLHEDLMLTNDFFIRSFRRLDLIIPEAQEAQ